MWESARCLINTRRNYARNIYIRLPERRMYIIIPMDMTAVNVRGTIVDAMYMLRFTVELRFCILQGRSLYRDAWPPDFVNAYPKTPQ